MAKSNKFTQFLEIFVIHLWLCVIFAFLFHTVSRRAADGSPLKPPRPPAQCEITENQGKQCGLAAADLRLKYTDAAKPFYLVHSAQSVPCSFLHPRSALNRGDLPLAAAAAGDKCGYEYGGAINGDDEVCGVLSENPCSLRLVSAEQLKPCATVAAGPFDQQGNRMEGDDVLPFLTVLPALNVSDTLLDVMELRETAGARPARQAAWNGIAFSGWLVAPLQNLLVPSGSLHSMERALVSVGAAVAAFPRPDPVLIDLAALTNCPSNEELAWLVDTVRATGMRPFGYGPEVGLAREPRAVLKVRDRVFARLLTYRVREGEGAFCPTLPDVQPGKIAELLEEEISAMESADAVLVVFLHWPDSVDAEGLAQRSNVLKDLIDAGLPLVLGTDSGIARGVATSDSGLGILNIGTYFDERNILSSSASPAGLMVQCSRLGPAGLTCTTLPVGHSLGDPVPVTNNSCLSCALLPTGFFSALWPHHECR